MNNQRNVFGEELATCSTRPMTGYTRNGCCETGADDAASHTVCVEVTESFLEYSKSVGNDLSTPVPAFRFAGLKPADRWCLCAARWQQALNDGCAPHVVLAATHERCLELIAMDDLKAHALDLV